MDILERSRMVADLSDRIAEVNRRILERSRQGERADPDDRRLLNDLVEQLESTSSSNEADGEASAKTA